MQQGYGQPPGGHGGGQWGHGGGHGQPPGYGGPPAQPTSGICVTANYIFLQWMLAFTNPVITVYGQPYPLKWDRPQIVPMPPGNHQINIHFPWMFAKGNPTDALIPIHPGFVTDIKYTTSFFTFTSGTIIQRGFRPWGT